MAQHVPRVFAYPLIEPLTYFELYRKLHGRSRFDDSVVSDDEAPSVKQDLQLWNYPHLAHIPSLDRTFALKMHGVDVSSAHDLAGFY